MAKTVEDRIEDEVRRRISELLSSAGVARSRLSQEILFLLPPEFVRMYRDLFDRALGDPIARAGDGGKDEGRIKASGKSKDAMRTRSMGPAAGGGKRFVAGSWPVRSEAALEEKRKLDRSIIRAVERAMGAAGGGKPSHPQGNTLTKQCPECGKIQASEWLRCPFHN